MWNAFKGKDSTRARYWILLCWGNQFMNQVGGVNLVINNIPLILRSNVGLSENVSKILGGFFQICMMGFGIILSSFLDRIVRRPYMIFEYLKLGFSMMSITILLNNSTYETLIAATTFFSSIWAFSEQPWIASFGFMFLKLYRFNSEYGFHQLGLYLIGFGTLLL